MAEALQGSEQAGAYLLRGHGDLREGREQRLLGSCLEGVELLGQFLLLRGTNRRGEEV